MTKVHHVALFVSDMDRMIHLFRDILSFDLVWRLPRVGGKRLSTLLGLPNMEAELAYLESRADDTAVELSRLLFPDVTEESATFGAPGSVVLSLVVADVDQIYRQIQDEGWSPLSPCLDMKSPAGDPIRLFCFRTEEGITLELIEQKNEGLS
jgi:catechol 2,3-dioxygenase-like lactoylglutathione lyase family enzyme